MKKLIIAFVAVAAIAQADISVNLFTEYGFYTGSAVALSEGETGLFQLIDAGVDGVVGSVTAAGGGMFGDDSLIDTVSVTATASGDSDFTGYAYLGGSTLTGSASGANVFARLYLVSTDVGALYYDGSIASIPNVNLAGSPPPTPTGYNFGGAAGVDTSSFSTVIPEPATIGLMGIAAAGLFTARRKVQA